MAKHFDLDIADTRFSFTRKAAEITAEAASDGIYVVRTSLPAETFDDATTVRSYKSLALVERAFRCIKTVDLQVRPIHHWLADVDVVFEISEGAIPEISKVVFVGNGAFSDSILRGVVSSKQAGSWCWSAAARTYDPKRVDYDRELLRRFYHRNGYVDFKVSSAASTPVPDRPVSLTFAINEGKRYLIREVTITSQLARISVDDLRGGLQIQEGTWYDADAVGRTVDLMERDLHSRGYAFIDVRPQISRNADKHIIDLTFDVGEGPRVSVERIDIVGNTRTKDKVIRREFRLAEGDAFNAEAVRRSSQRLQDLNYFNRVNIEPSPALSSLDKAILTATVEEKATGSLGASVRLGKGGVPSLDLAIKEPNFLGRGCATWAGGHDLRCQLQDVVGAIGHERIPKPAELM
jgi:outer membrane protein insertion porin family